MKLSEAIRKGCETTTMKRGAYIRDLRQFDEGVHACALGAAWIGTFPGQHPPNGGNYIMAELVDEYPELRSAIPNLPSQIMARNDNRDTNPGMDIWTRWTREEIADWLEAKGF